MAETAPVWAEIRAEKKATSALARLPSTPMEKEACVRSHNENGGPVRSMSREGVHLGPRIRMGGHRASEGDRLSSVGG